MHRHRGALLKVAGPCKANRNRTEVVHGTGRAAGTGGRAPPRGGAARATPAESAAYSATNSAVPWSTLHGTAAVVATHERAQQHTPGLRAGFALGPAPRHNKPFSRRTAGFWAMPHAWGVTAPCHPARAPTQLPINGAGGVRRVTRLRAAQERALGTPAAPDVGLARAGEQRGRRRARRRAVCAGRMGQWVRGGWVPKETLLRSWCLNSRYDH
jgi:hypothetical protein